MRDRSAGDRLPSHSEHPRQAIGDLGWHSSYNRRPEEGRMKARGAGRRILLAAAGCAVAILVSGLDPAKAQQTPQGRGGGRGGGMASALFTAIDANKDGVATREELRARFDSWYSEWDASKKNALSIEQLF